MSDSDLLTRLAPLRGLEQEWKQRAANERIDNWCNTEDRLIWKAIHDHRAQVFENCADQLAGVLASL